MKLFFLYLSTILLGFPEDSGFYNIKFESLDGTVLNTSSCQGKKVVVAVVSANTAGVNLTRYLDSVQTTNTGVKVFVIPTGDFGGVVSGQALINLRAALGVTVTKPLKVKKSNGALQHPLFVWLTKVSKNKHFDMDVEGEGQVFMISATGTLYSVLMKDTPRTVISNIINQPFNE